MGRLKYNPKTSTGSNTESTKYGHGQLVVFDSLSILKAARKAQRRFRGGETSVNALQNYIGNNGEPTFRDIANQSRRRLNRMNLNGVEGAAFNVGGGLPEIFVVSDDSSALQDFESAVFGGGGITAIAELQNLFGRIQSVDNKAEVLFVISDVVGNRPVDPNGNPLVGNLGGATAGFTIAEPSGDDNVYIISISGAELQRINASRPDNPDNVNYYRSTFVGAIGEELSHLARRLEGNTTAGNPDYYNHDNVSNNYGRRIAVNDITAAYAATAVDVHNQTNVDVGNAFGKQIAGAGFVGSTASGYLRGYAGFAHGKLTWVKQQQAAGRISLKSSDITTLLSANAIKLISGRAATSTDLADYEIQDPPGFTKSVEDQQLLASLSASAQASISGSDDKARTVIPQAQSFGPDLHLKGDLGELGVGALVLEDINGDPIVFGTNDIKSVSVSAGRLVRKFEKDFVGYQVKGVSVDGSVVYKQTSDKGIVVTEGLGDPTTVKLANSPVGLDFADVGGILGQQLGYRIAGNNAVLGIATSAALNTLGTNLGELINEQFSESVGTQKSVEEIFKGSDTELLANLKSAGIGALSSFLTAELVEVLGVEGFGGELLNTAAGGYLSAIIENLPGILSNTISLSDVLSGVDPVTIVGSFLGNKLANEVVQFETIGGQVGGAVGSSLGVIAAVKLGALSLGPAGIIAIAAAAFLGNIVGGLIGSIFGGTPRSGADATWNEAEGRFVVANAYSRKGGSRETAEAMASTVAETFNAVLDAAGGRLDNPGDITTGNYGMRKSDFVYRPTSTRDKRAISFRVSSKQEDAFAKLTGYGIYQGLSDPDFQIIGGSAYVKRAVYASIDIGAQSATHFDQSALLGNIASAQAYENYLANSAVINAIVSAESDSVFAIETAINLARAVELGLTKRHRADWFGGFGSLVEEASTSVANVEFSFDYDPFSDQISRLIGVGDFVLGDTIDIAGQTAIEAGEGDDTIIVTHVTHNTDGFQVAGGGGHIANTSGLTINGEAADGSAVSIGVSATIDAGAGNDTVQAGDLGNNVFGGDGNDALYGGKLDDWLLGGDGNDLLDAGAQAGGLGGNGNYLNGGAGDDILRGREGSDWLEGGDGTDVLTGGAGGDILAGGAGSGDQLAGGADDDTYLFRRGDGADIIDDNVANALARVDTDDINIDQLSVGYKAQVDQVFAHAAAYEGQDYIQARYAALATGAIQKDWFGYLTPGLTSSASGTSRVAGGLDTITLGQGIGLGDIRLMRAAGTDDLVLQITEYDAAAEQEVLTGDQITIANWFGNPFQRVELLKFVDGTEVRIGDITSFIVGGDADEVLIGTAGNDFIHGGGGNDELYALQGNDVAIGGTGDDLVSGGADNDIVIGGLGVDRLIGGDGDDALSGDNGGDNLFGGNGNDILSGGTGDGDIVVGGAGDDVFKYARGDGHDTIFDNYSNHWDVVWQNGSWINGYVFDAETSEVTGPDGTVVRENAGTSEDPDYRWVGQFDYDEVSGQLRRFNAPNGAAVSADTGTDTLEFGLDIRIQDIILSRTADSNDLRLIIASENNDGASDDSIVLKDWYSAPGQIEKLAFYSTGILDISETGVSLIAGTDISDGSLLAPLTGTAGRDWITGGQGDDHIAGGSSDDIIAGNSGSDYLKGEAGGDVLYGGSGNDILDGGTGADLLSGGNGSDTATYISSTQGVVAHLSNAGANENDAAGDVYDSIENLIGSSSDDILSGDDRDNELTGGAGSDVLSGGAGSDTYFWNEGDGWDQISDGVTELQEVVTADGALAPGYTVSKWEATDVKIPTFIPFFDLTDEELAELTPEELAFLEQLILAWGVGGLNEYYHRLEIQDPNGEVVYSYDQFTQQSTTPPPPSQYNQDGWLGGFERTNGQQVTRMASSAGADNGSDDVLEFGEGISISDLEFFRDGNNLTIWSAQSQTALATIVDQFTDHGKIEWLQFRDGGAVSISSIITSDISAGIVAGTAEDDFVVGSSYSNDTLLGEGGDDFLSGAAGDDSLSGGDGDDMLEGGAGADIINGGANSSYANGGENKASWGDTARYVGSDAAVTVDLQNTASGQSGGDASGDILTEIEHVTGSRHGDTLTGNEDANRLIGLEGDDIITGLAGDDALLGDAGNDQLFGGAGEDNLSGADGDDLLDGGSGDDILDGGDGLDSLSGGDGDDILNAGAGGGSLSGGTGADSLNGGTGNDQIDGGAGNDVLIGGAGNDQLDGGMGDDRYFFSRGFGYDLIIDTNGTNEILLDADISFDELWLTREGSDLVVRVLGTDDSFRFDGFYATTDTPFLKSIQTSTHRLFLDHPHAAMLVDVMSAASAGVGIPENMPADILESLADYWDAGSTAAPRAPQQAIALETQEDIATVAQLVGAIDHDKNITGYQLGQNAANGSVNINADTGEFIYTPGLDYIGEDSFTVIVEDADQNAVEIPVSVTVTPRNDGPRNVRSVGDLLVAEAASGSDTAVATYVGIITADDIEQDNVTFSLLNDAEGRFYIESDGTIRVNNPAQLDFESSQSHTITIRAIDEFDAYTDVDFSVTLIDVNEGNSFAAPYEWSVSENSGTVVVGTLQAADQDGGGTQYAEQRYYFWDGGATSSVSSDNRFSINELTGELTALQSFDFEAESGSAVYQIAARDNAGGAGYNQALSTVTISVDDVNEANELPGAASLSISEGLAPGQNIGTIEATDPDVGAFGDQRYYFVTTSGIANISADGLFRIDELSGEITSNILLSYNDHGPLQTYEIIARDSQGTGNYFEDSATVAITIINVNEAPDRPIVSFLTGSVSEQVGGGLAGSLVADFTLSDPDGDPVNLELVENPGNRFGVTGNELRFAQDFEPDFEQLLALGFAATDLDQDGLQEIELTATVRATDGSLTSAQAETVSIIIEDTNEAPTALNWTPLIAAVDERDRIAADQPSPAITIGSVSVDDPDTAGALNAEYDYAVSDIRFEIVNGDLRLRDGESLDFESEPVINLIITATDRSNEPLNIDREVEITVANADDILNGTANNDVLVGQQNRDIISGLSGNDDIDGGAGNDELFGDSGNDTIIGGAGDDVVDGGSGADILSGGIGNDILRAGTSVTAYADQLFGDAGMDRLEGGIGDDILNGGMGADELIGGAGSDTADYSQLSDGIAAASGVTVDLENSVSNAGAAAGDTFDGIENLNGTDFDDILRGDGAANSLSGNSGSDTLSGRGGDDILHGQGGNDLLFGDDGADHLHGNSGNDIIYGGDGNDSLWGGDGDDELYAQSGDDYLDGGAGNDILNGGVDNDTFIVMRDSGHDTIFNYDPNGADIDVLGFQDSEGVIEDEDLWFERSGDDMIITVIGSDTSATIKDWYTISDPESRANYKIDFIIAGSRSSKEIDVESLVTLMATQAKPSSAAERDTLLADPAYRAQWALHWGINADPEISIIPDSQTDEDTNLIIQVTATDDITPVAGIQISASVIAGTEVIGDEGLSFGAPDAQGQRSLTLSPKLNASGVATIRIVATDGGGASFVREFNINVTPVVDAPSIISFVGGQGTSGEAIGIAISASVDFPDFDGSEVNEIEIAGVPVGVNLSAGTYNSGTQLWELSSAELSGLRVFAPEGWSQDLDLTLTARSSENGQQEERSAQTTVVVNAPPTSATFAGVVNENASNNTIVGTIAGVDPDNDILTYQLLNDADGRFAVNSAGVVRVANGSRLNHEANGSHNITARITDSFGKHIDRGFTIAVNDVNEVNNLNIPAAFAISENHAGNGTIVRSVGTIAATDLDDAGSNFGKQRYYFVGGSGLSADGRFAIDSETGVISTNQYLNYESGSNSLEYEVIARDNLGTGSTAQATVHINITAVNEANNLGAHGPYNIVENDAANTSTGRVVGTIQASDPDSSTNGAQRYYFNNSSGGLSSISSDGRYNIGATTGIIKTNSLLNYEAGGTARDYTIVARDNAGNSGYFQDSTTVRINVTNKNEQNSLAAHGPFSINENVAVNTLVNQVTATDIDGVGTTQGSQRYYFLNGATASAISSDGRYKISATTGQVRTNAALNFEAASPVKNYVIAARDNAGGTGYNQKSISVQIGINNVNEANSLPASYSFGVAENLATGATVGTIQASDIDGAGTTQGKQHYSFLNGASRSQVSSDGRYAIDLNSGVITTRSPLNHEVADPAKAYAVVARDNAGNGNQRQTTVNIAISDVNELGSVTSFASAYVNENSAIGTVFSDVNGTDPDSGAYGSLRFYFAGGNAVSSDNRFRINATTGNISTNVALDYEAGIVADTYTVITRDNGGSGLEASAQVTLGVNDVNETHSVSNGSDTVGEITGLPPLTPLVYSADVLNYSDPESRNVQWRFVGGSNVDPSGRWRIDSNNGAISSVSGTIDYEDIVNYRVYVERPTGNPEEPYIGYYQNRTDPSRAIFNLAVEAYDGDFSKTATLTLTVTDTNEAPVLTSGATEFFIVDDKGEGKFATVQGTDLENPGATVYYSLRNFYKEEFDITPGSSADVDNGYPTVTVNSAGELRFEVPNDGEWEGGIRHHASGGRRYLTLVYNYDLVLSDAQGNENLVPIKITFLKHGVHNAPPVVFDLDGDGLELTTLEGSNVYFDMDADGDRDLTGWVGGDDGILALDRNGNGTIDDVTEISFADAENDALTDLEGLRVFDTNENNFLDVGDAQFSEFQIWRDINQDGVSQAAELFTLAELDITAVNLDLALTGEDPEDAYENVLYGTTQYIKGDGTVGVAGDVFLAFDPSENFALAAPIILDFDGDGAGLISVSESGVFFDQDGDGELERTGWFESGDAVLALDRNSDGMITDIAEISFLGDLAGATTDLEGLKAFDSNTDGILSSDDARFSEFKLWFDRNTNGITDAGELFGLAEAGVASINLGSVKEQQNDPEPQDNIIFGRGTYTTTDGTNGGLLDAAFAYIADGDTSDLEFSGWNGDLAPSTIEETPSENILADTATPTDVRADIEVREKIQPSIEAFAEQYEIADNRSRDPREPGLKYFGASERVDNNRSLADISKSLSISGNMGVFDYFADASNGVAESDLYEKVRAVDTESQITAANDDKDTLKIALMTQTMNSFGATAAAEMIKQRENGITPLDYFAG